MIWFPEILNGWLSFPNVIFIGKLYGKKIFSLRKKKANELIDDDYDYTPNIKNNVISFEWNNFWYNSLIFF